MRPEPLHLAFLGCGAVTAMHSRTLARIAPRVRRLYASCDRGLAADYERRLRGVGSYGSYEAALADGLIDVVLVATPPDSHVALALEALRHGKHVIVQKPVAVRSADCALLADAAAEAGRQILVAENYRYKPLTRVLNRLVGSGAVGELRLVQLNVFGNQDAAGWLHLLSSIGPKVRSVRCFGTHDPPPSALTTLVVAEFETGAVGMLAHPWETRSFALSRIYGSEGSIAFETNGLLTITWGKRKRFIPPSIRDAGGYRAMFADFLSVLCDGGEPRMTLAHARRDLELVEQAYGQERP